MPSSAPLPAAPFAAPVEAAPSVRPPLQERSRRSFDRVVDAAVELLVERRSAGFTLAEVATRSGVSIGSIYARVASKDALLRFAHTREMERMAAETEQAFAEPQLINQPVAASLADVVRRAVGSLADLLARHASVMAPFMRLANDDPVISAGGKRGYMQMEASFTGLLLTAAGQIRRPDPQAAATWACTVSWSVLARQLGLGSDPAAALDHPRDAVVRDLQELILAYLATDPTKPRSH